MQDGDLSSWETARAVVVMEGFLLPPLEPRPHGLLRHRNYVMADAHDWPINLGRLKEAVDFGRYNIAVDVWSFLPEEIADALFDRLLRLSPHGLATMTRWATVDEAKMHLDVSPDILYVYDWDTERLLRWGARGCRVMPL